MEKSPIISNCKGSTYSTFAAFAMAIVARLTARDILSIVTFDHTAQVIWSPTEVTATNLDEIRRALRNISVGGSTALFEGLSKAAEQVAKNMDKMKSDNPTYTNRLILLSDGAANVGPMHPLDFQRLSKKLGRANISVTTIGFGPNYDEDVLTDIAHLSDGNHAFIDNGDNLHEVLDKEFTHALNVAAADISTKIRFPHFVKPLKVLGPTAQIDANEIRISFNQLYGYQQKRAIIEIQVAPQLKREWQMVAAAQCTYYVTAGEKTKEHKQKCQAFLSFVKSAETAQVNKPVMEQVIVALTNAVSKMAVDLRDAGRTKEAQRACYANQRTIIGALETYNLDNTPRLKELWIKNGDYANQMAQSNWNNLRKQMRADQFGLDH